MNNKNKQIRQSFTLARLLLQNRCPENLGHLFLRLSVL